MRLAPISLELSLRAEAFGWMIPATKEKAPIGFVRD
jgi:hypothetical protein